MLHTSLCISQSIFNVSEITRSNCGQWLLSPIKKRRSPIRPWNRAEIQKRCLRKTKNFLLFLLVIPMSYFYTYLGVGSKGRQRMCACLHLADKIAPKGLAV